MFVKGNRRHFLKTASGLLVSIPFLPSMSQAQTTNKKLRFVTARSQQGTYKDLFRPNVQGIPSTPLLGEALSYDLTKIAGPLSSFMGPEMNALKSKINFYKGLDSMVTWGGHNHSTFLAAYQTCTPDAQISITETPVGQEKLFPPKPTIDQLISALAFSKPYDVHNVVMTDYEYNVECMSYSYAMSGNRLVRVRGYWSPEVHFQKFFGTSVQSPTMASAKADRRKFVVDQVLSSYKSFVSSRSLASVDKLALDSHMEFLFSIQQRMANLGFQGCANPGIVIDPKLTFSNIALERAELVDATYKLVIDVAVAAMRCDAIRVFNFCMYQSGANVAGGGPHGMHHMDVNEANKKTYATGHEVWYGKMFAYLVNQMNAIQDPEGGSILDNSLVLTGKEMSHEGPDHGTRDMLVATVGGLGGKIKTGQFLDYHRTLKTPNQPYGDLIQGRSYNQFLTSIMMGGYGLLPAQFETNGDFGERIETIWANTPFVEKRVLLPGMFNT